MTANANPTGNSAASRLIAAVLAVSAAALTVLTQARPPIRDDAAYSMTPARTKPSAPPNGNDVTALGIRRNRPTYPDAQTAVPNRVAPAPAERYAADPRKSPTSGRQL